MTRRSDEGAGWGTLLAIAAAGAGIFVLVKANREEEKLVRRVLPKLPEVPWWATAPLMPFVPGLAPAAVARAVVSRKARMDQSDLYTQVQTKLNALGYAVPVTGANDSATHAAVTAFQRARGLLVDGLVGPQTLGALGIVAPAPTILPWKSYQPSSDEAAQALATAFQRVTGSAPSSSVLALLMAQTSFETRPKGQTTGWNLPNFNWGGIKASLWDPFIQIFQTAEGYGSSEVHAPLKFAAYTSLADGAEAYIRTLKARSNWWNGLLTGDPSAFIRGLTTPPAYFTGDPTNYLAGLRGLSAAYSAVAQKWASV